MLSNTLEILYTTTDRRQTVTKINTIDRLLDQWIHSLPDHLQTEHGTLAEASSPDVEVEHAIAFLRLSYLYTRLAAHRVAISFYPSAPQYAKSLHRCMTKSIEIIRLNSNCRHYVLPFDVNPGSHVYTLWSCGLLLLFGVWESRVSETLQLSSSEESNALEAAYTCIDILEFLAAAGRDGEKTRAENLRSIAVTMSPNKNPLESGISLTKKQDNQTVQWSSLSINRRPPERSHTSLSPESPFHHPSLPPTQLTPPMFGDPSVPTGPAPSSGLSAPPPQHQQQQHPQQQQQPQPHPQPIPSQFQNIPQMEIQSPGLSRMAMAAASPGLAEGFNLDFSSPFAHPYERLGSFPPLSDTGAHAMNVNGQFAPRDQQQSIRHVWDDPVFNIPPMMQVTPPAQGSSAPYTMDDIIPTPSSSNDTENFRKRARVGTP